FDILKNAFWRFLFQKINEVCYNNLELRNTLLSKEIQIRNFFSAPNPRQPDAKKISYLNSKTNFVIQR
ncbi:MAG: hypothetical protein U9P88_02260, partial [Patescibacteria group bacterium]|nr:hypothetical protein [Patescibacteria group bacterium]